MTAIAHGARTSPAQVLQPGVRSDISIAATGKVVILTFSGDAAADANRIGALVRDDPSIVPVIKADKNALRPDDVVVLMRAGAFDVVLTPIDEPACARRIAAAETEAARRQERHDTGCAAAACMERLTPRERDVARELIAGASNKLAARHLGLSPRTVEFHRARIFEKLGIASVAELTGVALLAQCATCWLGGAPPKRSAPLS